jgi:hypothetical protein
MDDAEVELFDVPGFGLSEVGDAERDMVTAHIGEGGSGIAARNSEVGHSRSPRFAAPAALPASLRRDCAGSDARIILVMFQTMLNITQQ